MQQGVGDVWAPWPQPHVVMQPSEAPSALNAAPEGSPAEEPVCAGAGRGVEGRGGQGAGAAEAAPGQADGEEPSSSAAPSPQPNGAAGATSDITASSSNPSGGTAAGRAAARPPGANIPVLPDIVRQKDAKRDLPLVCHIEGCGFDLQGQAEYYQRYRICKAHLKSSALLVDGVPQRFCQQCGRFHELRDFDGEKRNCRARLEQHNSRRRKVFVTGQSTRRSRSQKDRTLHSRGGPGAGEEEDVVEGMVGVDEAALLGQHSSHGGAGGRAKQLAGTRRPRGVMEAEEPLTLTPQEKEAILLLRQAERPGTVQGLPRFLSEPVRGLRGGWQADAGAADVGEGLLADEALLHSQLQDLLGQQPFLSRQQQVAGAVLAQGGSRLGGSGVGGSAFHSMSPQPSQQQQPSVWRLPPPVKLPSFASSNGREEARLANFLSAAAQPAGLGANPFVSVSATSAAGALLEQAGGLCHNFTEPVGMRSRGRGGGSRASAASQLLAPTIPRNGLSLCPPRDAADLLRSLTNAGTPTATPPPVPQPVTNPFMQQRATPKPSANPLGGLGNIAALLGSAGLGAAGLGGSGPKASTLLRQMADLAASAEQSMEQAAMQQPPAGPPAQPLASADIFQGPLHLVTEDLLRRLTSSASASATAPAQQSAPFGNGGGSGGEAADAAAKLLAALAGASLPQPQQLEQQPSGGVVSGSAGAGDSGGKDVMSEVLLAALLSDTNTSSQMQAGSSALVQNLLQLLQGSSQGQHVHQQQHQQPEAQAQ